MGTWMYTDTHPCESVYRDVAGTKKTIQTHANTHTYPQTYVTYPPLDKSTHTYLECTELYIYDWMRSCLVAGCACAYLCMRQWLPAMTVYTHMCVCTHTPTPLPPPALPSLSNTYILCKSCVETRHGMWGLTVQLRRLCSCCIFGCMYIYVCL